jgi:class 3 adenylate cyclase
MRKSKKVELLTELSESLISDSADLYLLFVDLSGSTDYKHNIVSNGLPDTIWILRQLTFLDRVAKLIRRYGGSVVKTIGDEVFGCFDASTDPNDAFLCAVEALKICRNLRSFTGRSRIEAKASLDVGLTYNGSLADKEDYDPIGTPVDRCARLIGIADKNELIMSDDFHTNLIHSYTKSGKPVRLKLNTRTSNLKGLGSVRYHRYLVR